MEKIKTNRLDILNWCTNIEQGALTQAINLDKTQIHVISLNYGEEYEDWGRIPLVATFSEKLAIDIKDDLTAIIDELIPKRDAIFEEFSTVCDGAPAENFEECLNEEQSWKEQRVKQLIATHIPKSKYLAEYEGRITHFLLEGYGMYISIESVNFKGE